MTAPARMRLTAAEANALLTAPRQSKGRYPVASKERRTVGKIVFASLGEAKRYGALELLERAGAISHLELQPVFPVWIGDAVLCRYTADFKYTDVATGDVIIEDAKSSGTAKDDAYKLRKRAAELYHKIKIVEVLA